MATTPDNTRRETIEECARIAETGRAKPGSAAWRCSGIIAADIRALASAEPQASEAGRPDPDFLLADAKARVAGVNLDGSPRREGVYTRPAPAPSQAAETEGLVERLNGPHEWGYRDVADGTFVQDDAPFDAAAQPPEITEAQVQRILALPWVTNDDTPPSEVEAMTYDLRRILASTGSRQEPAGDVSEAVIDAALDAFCCEGKRLVIDKPLVMSFQGARRRMRAALLAALRSQPAPLTTLETEIDQFLAHFAETQSPTHQRAAVYFLKQARAQLAARTQPPADVAEALRWYFDMLEEQVHGHSAQSSIWGGKSVTFERHEQARRLLASTGSPQEPAGGDLAQRMAASYCKTQELGHPDDEIVEAMQKVIAETGFSAALRSQPASRESGEAMREACAKVCLDRANYFDRAKGHREWKDAARSYRATADEIRALPTSHSGSAS